MRILAMERELPIAGARRMHDLLREESAAVWALRKHEVIRELWFTWADQRAVSLLACADVAEATRPLATPSLARERGVAFDVAARRAYPASRECLTARNASRADRLRIGCPAIRRNVANVPVRGRGPPGFDVVFGREKFVASASRSCAAASWRPRTVERRLLTDPRSPLPIRRTAAEDHPTLFRAPRPSAVAAARSGT